MDHLPIKQEQSLKDKTNKIKYKTKIISKRCIKQKDAKCGIKNTFEMCSNLSCFQFKTNHCIHRMLYQNLTLSN